MEIIIIEPDIVKFVLPEEIELTNSQEIKRKVYENTFEKGYKKILLDFSKTKYIDSTGLGVVIMIHKQSLMNAGTTAIINIDSNLRNLFKMTALDRIFNIFDDEKSAVSFLKL
ncbi:MAG: STAS domain-containing protein [Fervidobacterium sp.]|nr:STAS domain-containing protein [Fervidobacterium sp.]